MTTPAATASAMSSNTAIKVETPRLLPILSIFIQQERDEGYLIELLRNNITY
jgi:hypothetical protein